jgi:lysophospholipid acyltransferase (LPLAT)-like uncharacterized protein
MRHGRAAHLAITPDGPRGPRRVVQLGAVYLASRTGMPLVPMGLAFDRPWRAPSWDRMAIPRPWHAARCVLAQPMDVPADLDDDGLEQYRLKVQAALDDAQARAEALAAGAPPPGRLLSLGDILGSVRVPNG